VTFKEAAKLGSCLSKDYAEDIFRLLVTYKSISASEAASRLDLHIRTVQDFLEDLYELKIIDREEVYEGKRPYYRYRIEAGTITMTIDLGSFTPAHGVIDDRLKIRIREKVNSRVRFTVSRSNDHFSSVTIWIGEGRTHTEKKINLSMPQGKFLFYLPFPTAAPSTISEIMKKAGIAEDNIPEILDIVNVLIDHQVIETL